MKWLRLILIAFLSAWSSRAAEPVQISTWYWLNSIERTSWEKDFRVISETGFSHVILCWGLDASAVATQSTNTLHALDICQRHGLKAYVLAWHPAYNKLNRQARFQQVDNNGNLLFTFNPFNRAWRMTQWRPYLQSIAAAYKKHPAFAGYLFDDTFYIGQVESLLGNKSKKRGDFVSYSESDTEQFQSWLKKKYPNIPALNAAWKTNFHDWNQAVPPRQIAEHNTPAWQDWCNARLEWLHEWAAETVQSIREVDSNTEHEIVIEDGEYVLGRPRKSRDSYRPVTLQDSVGVSFGTVTQPFDAVCVYATWPWKGTNGLANALEKTSTILREVRTKVGPDKKVIYGFWVAEPALDQTPSEIPTAQQISKITEAALQAGVHHVSYYGFRIGDWRVTEAEWNSYQSDKPDYPTTKPLSGRFLCDRPQLLRELKPRLQLFRQANK